MVFVRACFYHSAINARGKSCEYLDPDIRNFSLAHLSPSGKSTLSQKPFGRPWVRLATCIVCFAWFRSDHVQRVHRVQRVLVCTASLHQSAHTPWFEPTAVYNLDPDTRNFSLAHLSPRGKKHAHTKTINGRGVMRSLLSTAFCSSYGQYTCAADTCSSFHFVSSLHFSSRTFQTITFTPQPWLCLWVPPFLP